MQVPTISGLIFDSYIAIAIYGGLDYSLCELFPWGIKDIFE